MKRILYVLIIFVIASSCHRYPDKDKIKEEIFQTEKAFEKMASIKGLEEAFYYFADRDALILRKNDTLIKGKENIRNYYGKKNLNNVTVNWSPDYIYVSDCGTLGYTYGKYIWKIRNDNGVFTEINGIFHTVWKKQKNNTWKYVWD